MCVSYLPNDWHSSCVAVFKELHATVQQLGRAADSTVVCEIVQAVLSQLASGRGAASQGDCAKQPCLPADSDHALASLQQEAER